MVGSAIVLALSLICSLGPRPLSPQLTDYIAHASGSSCSGALPSGTIIGMAATRDDGGYWIANDQGLVVACGDRTVGGLTDAPTPQSSALRPPRMAGGTTSSLPDGGLHVQRHPPSRVRPEISG